MVSTYEEFVQSHYTKFWGAVSVSIVFGSLLFSSPLIFYYTKSLSLFLTVLLVGASSLALSLYLVNEWSQLRLRLKVVTVVEGDNVRVCLWNLEEFPIPIDKVELCGGEGRVLKSVEIGRRIRPNERFCIDVKVGEDIHFLEDVKVLLPDFVIIRDVRGVFSDLVLPRH